MFYAKAVRWRVAQDLASKDCTGNSEDDVHGRLCTVLRAALNISMLRLSLNHATGIYLTRCKDVLPVSERERERDRIFCQRRQ
jgi:hypothetical protein